LRTIAILGAIFALGFGGLAFAQQNGLSSFVSSTHKGPVQITGRTFIYDYKTDSFTVRGDAVITQQASVLTADEANLERRLHLLHAKGHVHLVDPLGDLKGSEGWINLADETAVLDDGTVTNKDKSYLLKGKKITKVTGQHYKVTDGFFTTCGRQPGTPDWSIDADDMDVHLGQTATAHAARFNILGYPVMYSPYAVFPADTDRHSGFLAPRLGESGLRGFQLVEPYYWAINKSSDATAAVDVETSQRVGGLAEYRLISGVGDYFVVDGAFYDESLRSEDNREDDIIDNQVADPHIPLDRYDVIGMGRQHLTDNLVLYGDGMTVSDSFFLREMNVWTLSRTVGPGIVFPNTMQALRDAYSDFGALYSYDDGYARLQGDWNQDLIQAQDFSLQRLPQGLVSGRYDLLGGLAYADYDFEGDNFWRSMGESGQRLDLFPRVTIPWRLSKYLYGWGTLDLRETIYSVGGDQINVIPVGTHGLQYNNSLALGNVGDGGFHSREMIYGNTGVASEVERIYDLNWKYIEKIKHTIEPFVTYSYVPQYDQNSLPLYDAVDRIDSRSLISYGLTSRIFAKLPATQAPASESTPSPSTSILDQGAETTDSPTYSPFRARISTGGSSVVELFRFTLLQAYDTEHAVAPGGPRFSDLDITGTLFPTRVWSLGGQMGYEPQGNRIRYASAYMNFQPWWTQNQSNVYQGKAEEGSFLQASYNYIAPGPAAQPGVNADYSQSLVLRAYYDLFDRLGVYFAPSYDFVAHKMLSAEYGIRIKSPCDCWAFDTGITKTVNPSETQFQFQLTLGGIGSVGQSPFGRNPFQLRTGVLPNYQ
jgi:LPS-assembly protein